MIPGSRSLAKVVNAGAIFGGMYPEAFLYENQHHDRLSGSPAASPDALPMVEPSHIILIPEMMTEADRFTFARHFPMVKELTYRGMPARVLRDPSHPTYIPSDFEHGVAHFAAGRQDEAMTSFKAFQHRYPDQIDNLNFLGILHWLSGDSEKAGACFRAILRHWPGSVGATLNLAFVLARAGDYAAADSLMNTVRRSVPVPQIDRLASHIRARAAPPYEGFYMNDLFITDLRSTVLRDDIFRRNSQI